MTEHLIWHSSCALSLPITRGVDRLTLSRSELGCALKANVSFAHSPFLRLSFASTLNPGMVGS